MHKTSNARRVRIGISEKKDGSRRISNVQGIACLEKGAKDDTGTNSECASTEVSHSSHGGGSCLRGTACGAVSCSGPAASGCGASAGSGGNCGSSEVCGIKMATVSCLGCGASCLSSSTVDIIDGIGIADLELLLADEGWQCLLVVLETGCGVVGSAGAVVGESRLSRCCQRLKELTGKTPRRTERDLTALQVFKL
jgi:hypothetical protein